MVYKNLDEIGLPASYNILRDLKCANRFPHSDGIITPTPEGAMTITLTKYWGLGKGGGAGKPRNAGIRLLAYHSVPIQHVGSFSLWPLKLYYNLPLTLTLNPYHYQVHTFLIFTNVLD